MIFLIKVNIKIDMYVLRTYAYDPARNTGKGNLKRHQYEAALID